MGLTPQALWQQVTIPADAPAVTVSFWYWVDGLPRTDLQVYLASNMYKFTPGFNGADLGRISPYLLPGWQLFRQVLKPDELAKVRGKTLWLAFRLYDPLGTDDTLTFRIDDVQIVGAAVRTAAAPLPAALRGDGTQPLALIREDANWRPACPGKVVRTLNSACLAAGGRIYLPPVRRHGTSEVIVPDVCVTSVARLSAVRIRHIIAA